MNDPGTPGHTAGTGPRDRPRGGRSRPKQHTGRRRGRPWRRRHGPAPGAGHGPGPAPGPAPGAGLLGLRPGPAPRRALAGLGHPRRLGGHPGRSLLVAGVHAPAVRPGERLVQLFQHHPGPAGPGFPGPVQFHLGQCRGLRPGHGRRGRPGLFDHAHRRRGAPGVAGVHVGASARPHLLDGRGLAVLARAARRALRSSACTAPGPTTPSSAPWVSSSSIPWPPPPSPS